MNIKSGVILLGISQLQTDLLRVRCNQISLIHLLQQLSTPNRQVSISGKLFSVFVLF